MTYCAPSFAINSGQYTGDVNDFRIYSRELKEEEIRSLINNVSLSTAKVYPLGVIYTHTHTVFFMAKCIQRELLSSVGK